MADVKVTGVVEEAVTKMVEEALSAVVEEALVDALEESFEGEVEKAVSDIFEPDIDVEVEGLEDELEDIVELVGPAAVVVGVVTIEVDVIEFAVLEHCTTI